MCHGFDYIILSITVNSPFHQMAASSAGPQGCATRHAPRTRVRAAYEKLRGQIDRTRVRGLRAYAPRMAQNAPRSATLAPGLHGSPSVRSQMPQGAPTPLALGDLRARGHSAASRQRIETG